MIMYTKFKKTNNMKIKSLIIITVLVFCSCTRDNYLDFQPKGFILPTNLEDFRLLLDQNEGEGAYSTGFATTHFESLYATDNMQLTDSLVLALGLDRPSIAAYTFSDNLYAAGDDPEWNGYYNQIYNANIIIDGLEKLDTDAVGEKNALMAEAKLHRAFAYFNLVNLYGVHYDPSTATTDLGVPIREGVELEGLDYTRASVQEVYDYIIKDVLASYEDLPDLNAQKFRFRPSKAGTAGLLAKIHLYQADYNAALSEVNKALDIYSTVRDMNIDVDSTLGFGNITLPFAQEDDEIVWYKGISRVNDSPAILKKDVVANLYDANDLRIQGFFDPNILFSQDINDLDDILYWGKTYSRIIPTGINTPDLWLIKAECEARLGNITEANTALNTLSKQRFITDAYTDVNITDQNELLDYIKEERRRELIGQPDRLFDIKRYNRFDGDNISITRQYNGEINTIEPNSLNWAFPIAQKYILLNPEIEQNPRD